MSPRRGIGSPAVVTTVRNAFIAICAPKAGAICAPVTTKEVWYWDEAWVNGFRFPVVPTKNMNSGAYKAWSLPGPSCRDALFGSLLGIAWGSPARTPRRSESPGLCFPTCEFMAAFATALSFRGYLAFFCAFTFGLGCPQLSFLGNSPRFASGSCCVRRPPLALRWVNRWTVCPA